MFLRAKIRVKDGKAHRYFSVVENCRRPGGKIVQKHVLYLGEINDSQQASWCKSLDIFRDGRREQLAIFPDDRTPPPLPEHEVVQIQLSKLKLSKPRQWGACWLACEMWDTLRLNDFWLPRLNISREGTDWLGIYKAQVIYALLDHGSEWRLHRDWYGKTALGDLLGTGSVLSDDVLYRSLDNLLKHKAELFSFLKGRWADIFNAGYEVLLYDLTSTYFECDPPEGGKRRYGHSRDKRSDCVQVVIALIVTPDGFPLAYEVMNGNTSDRTTLPEFLRKIEDQYGKADRIWVMDRGIPTEKILEDMRNAAVPVSYLVGTPRGRLTVMEKTFLDKPWETAKDGVLVKMAESGGEIYILAKSGGRFKKEKAIRVRKIKRLWGGLKELQRQSPSRDHLLMKIGVIKKEAGRLFSLVNIKIPKQNEDVTTKTFSFKFNTAKYWKVLNREGSYLLRSNLKDADPAVLWQQYIQLTEIEQVFKELKSDLAIRPVYHQLDNRIEAHIFVAFSAYCLQVTLKHRLRPLARGLTPRAVFEKFAAIQMVDVHLPTTDNRHLILTRYTEPEDDVRLLLHEMKLKLPNQPPPKIARPPAQKTTVL
jgi:transposase